MNIPLLRKVQKAILKHPDQFNADNWFSDSLFIGGDRLLAGGCGTAACIAGWAIHVHSKNKRLVESKLFGWPDARAAKLLQLTHNQADNLFYTCDWPTNFFDAYSKAATPLARAKVAAARIKHFVKTKGAE